MHRVAAESVLCSNNDNDDEGGCSPPHAQVSHCSVGQQLVSVHPSTVPIC
jgi:hypothetical protein